MNKNIVKLILKATLLLAIGTSSSTSASFDCSKATTLIENEICSDSLLNNLDIELGRVYHKLLNYLPPDQANEIKKAQTGWINNRNKECIDANKDCITNTTKQRINLLENYLSTIDTSLIANQELPSADSNTIFDHNIETKQDFNKPPISVSINKANTSKKTKTLKKVLNKVFNNSIFKEINKFQIEQPGIFIFILLCLSSILILGGFLIHRHIRQKYRYNIYSIFNLLIPVISIITIIIGFFVAGQYGQNSGQIIYAFIGFSCLMIIGMFVNNWKKSTPLLALVSLFYQFLISFTIVIIIFMIIFSLKSKERTNI